MALFWASQGVAFSGAKASAAVALHHFGVSPNGTVGDQARLANLWKVSLIAAAGVLLQLLTMPLAIPTTPQNDGESRRPVWNEESLLHKWRERQRGETERPPTVSDSD